ncbi:BUD13 homolog [Culicoides brevitarsis]|uniref:BUD13 homolog n=1 Tax=Culicoides brevitarsis TaxID=469753 RepID=UPI00307C4ECA
MSHIKIDQKEYLKKYLSGDVGDDKKKKKKKKVKEIKGKTVTVVDDDWDFSKIKNMDDNAEIEASLLMNEDAPQIVGVIDERPPELKALDYKNKLWKGLNEVDETSRDSDGSKRRQERKRSEDLSPRRSRRDKSEDLSPQRPRKNKYDDDLSPKRSRRDKSEDFSPPRHRKRRESDDDLSPKRSRKRNEDLSPPRNRKNRHSDEDLSPKRASRRNRSPDNSPPRRKNERDLSPKRRKPSRFTDASPTRQSLSPNKVRKDLDLSPIRKNHRSADERRERKRSSDLSPRRNRRQSPSSSRARDFSPERRYQKPSKRQVSDSPPPTHGKMKRTMDGKVAGLQDAANLKVENAKHSKRESEMYENMTDEMSGRNAEARVRATGAVDRRKLEANLAKEREKEEKYAERKQVYDKWGKGVKQLEDYKAHLEQAARDASKPFARYAGDEDVERHLKEQERLEDPMLQYMRSKKQKKDVKEKVPMKPIYKGLFPDNRFNIRPGYRWDGVDRSNGYEKRHFEAINVRKATEEEAYLYSTEDM